MENTNHFQWSKNQKLNNLLSSIEESIKKNEEWETEIKRYYKEFPYEIDYNYVQYGNLLIGYSEIYELFSNSGYTSTNNLPINKIWELYRGQVGFVIRSLINNSH